MVRALAAVVAVVLLVLFFYTGYRAAVTDDLVTPTNGVIGRSTVDDPAPGTRHEQLRARTELQRWREVSGPSPSDPTPAAPTIGTGSGGASPVTGKPMRTGDGRAEVEDWLNRRADDASLLHAARDVVGVSSLPEPVRNVFVQPGGRLWRTIHDNWIVFGGGLYLFGVAALLAGFLAGRGRVPLKEGFSGETVPRFNAFERANHWMTAASFVLLGLSGLVILYGKSVLRPWLGADLFDDLAQGSAWLHMALIVPFTLGLGVMIAVWTWQNLPKPIDWQWLKQGGGFLHDEGPNPPAEKFNAGQKLIFWSVVGGGTFLIVSGLGMMFPFLWTGYDGMQLAQGLHATAALVMIGIIFGHIYIGTIGMVGAFDAMWDGRVDRNWAKEHHSLWYRRLFARRHEQAAE